MKLINKKTGEIGYTAVLESKAIVVMDENAIQLGSYNSLAELNDEWEDYDEPSDYWFIDCDGSVYQNCQNSTKTHTNHHKVIGNYFETEKEAKKVVEKLEAWKRLKDRGFRFDNFVLSDEQIQDNKVIEDLDLLFGGEDE